MTNHKLQTNYKKTINKIQNKSKALTGAFLQATQWLTGHTA